MQIRIKAARVSFIIYSLCKKNYLYNFFFPSQFSKISSFKKKPDFINFYAIVYWLYKSLLRDKRYVIFINTFFTNVKLLTTLKSLGIGRYKIVKAKSGFFFNCLKSISYLLKKTTRV